MTHPTRTDGGSENGNATDPILALLIGLMGSLVASGFGDQWVLPGFMIGFTGYLILNSE
jgi:hypothetical protein